MKTKGYIQVYTGNGKGKTTAALGLSLRAAGHGLKTYIAQFMKKSEYSEIKAIYRFLSEYVTIEQFGLPEFHHSGEKVSAREEQVAMQGITAVKNALLSNKYDIIVLDEANVLLHFKIIDTKHILEILESKPENIEIVITGRYAPQEIIDKADLVTEMKEIKHYFQKKVIARPGIEK